ncbi:hypothetical protein GGI12_004360 [Dipsacomyces acuminosporus]|nr:hypothetical protein GGI12_004360 [Dipsacomyces acuminosporus]
MSDGNRTIKIVVVGGSYAGATAAKQLAGLANKGYPNLQVALVDQSTHYFHAVGFPKALVDGEYAERCFLPFSELFYTRAESQTHQEQPHSGDSSGEGASGHRFINQKLVAVKDAHHIELDNGKQLYFDYLVLATGSAFPKPVNVSAGTKSSGLEELSELRKGIAKAGSVLIVGGGPVGVETAGYVAAKHPEKKVTLVHGGDRLLPTNFKEGLSSGAVAKLKSIGVNVVLNERIALPAHFGQGAHIGREVLKGTSGSEYASDVQILATGFKVHSEFIKPLEELTDESLRVEDKGFIRILPTLQLASRRFPNIFVPGDANDLPMSTKYGFKAEMQGSTAAANIAKMISSGFDAEFKDASIYDIVSTPKLSVWSDMFDLTFVPIGPSLGVAQALKVALGGSSVANFVVRQVKSRDFFLSLRRSLFAGLQK